MNIELGFVPDIIIYFQFINGNPWVHNIWGDRNIYEYGREYITSLMKDNSGFFFSQKGLGKYQIIPGNMTND